MVHFEINENTVFEENRLGIPEPVNENPIDSLNVELILVPLVLGDKKGHRIGYGGGYYDRLLKDHEGLKVGLSLFPLIDEIPADPWDVKLDKILFPQ